MRYGNDLILPTHSRLVFKRNQAAISILKEVFVMNETDYNARLYAHCSYVCGCSDRTATDKAKADGEWI